MGCREWCHRVGTCCCVRYVCLTNVCNIFLGVIMLLLLGVFQLWESVDAEDHMAVIMRFWEAKLSMLMSAIFLLILACVVQNFIGKKKRCSGLCLLMWASLGLAWQVYAFAHLYANENSIAKIDEWFQTDLSNHEGLDEFLDVSRNNTLKNWYVTFYQTMQHWECTVEDEPALSVLSKGGESEALSAARLLSDVIVSETPTDQCDMPKIVECANRDEYALWATSFCIPPSNGGVSECTNCLAEFFDDFVQPALGDGIIPGTGIAAIDNDTMTELRNAFNGDTGTLFCRCMPAVFALTEWWTRTILITTMVYIVIEVIFLFSVMWLIVCGPDAATQDELAEIEEQKRLADPNDGSEMVQVTCPFDSGPGHMVMVHFGGRQKEVRVPPGIGPGVPFTAWV